MSYILSFYKIIFTNGIVNGISLFMKGSELKKKREELGLSRDELARELKTTYPTVYRWETDDRSIPPYLELALETIERKIKEKVCDKE